MKQMMTGEWNISDMANIHTTAVQRKQDYAAWQGSAAGDLLVGDGEAFADIPSGAIGLPGASGTGRGAVVTAADPAGLAKAEPGKLVLAGVQATVLGATAGRGNCPPGLPRLILIVVAGARKSRSFTIRRGWQLCRDLQ
jgi:hypothetical protein